ncbi:MAG: M14 family metallopeptidase [bacterium]
MTQEGAGRGFPAGAGSRTSRVIRAVRMMALLAVLLGSFSGFQLNLEKYYSNEEVVQFLKDAAKEFPNFVRIEGIGKSVQGRDMWAATVTNFQTGDAARKPALYIDGNIHGNEVQGTEVALYTMWYLLSRYRADPFAKKMLDEHTFYIVPVVNLDGRAVFLGGGTTADPDSPRHNMRPVDDDGDGLVDEDGPEDLDGDGMITQMRIKDPYGPFKTNKDDPRSLTFRNADEKGEYRVYDEGIDNDGDGDFNEDPVGGFDMNRNYPYGWRPGMSDYGGFYPLSEPETRATALFILKHPNIAAVMSYHNNGNMILRAPTSQTDTGIPQSDIQVYDILGNAGKIYLPDYRYLQTFTGLYPAYGTTVDYGYFGAGVISFTNELFQIPTEHPEQWWAAAAAELKWTDKMYHGAGWVDWHPFHHPQLGDVDIGGWAKLSRRTPPAEFLHELTLPNTLFTLNIVDNFPRVHIRNVKVTELDDTHFRVEADAVNDGAMATNTALAVQKGVAHPDWIEIRPGSDSSRIEVFAAGEEDITNGEIEKPEKRARVRFDRIAGGQRRRVAWIIRGQGKVQINLNSEKGYFDTASADL